MQVENATKHIFEKLQTLLPDYLQYHSLKHTKDVIKQVFRIAKEEGITDEEELSLLQTAAAYHDCGFLTSYNNHEERGCDIVQEVLPIYDYSQKQIDIIKKLIMATRVPQTAESRLEEIICDADLDYLGRDDFFKIGAYLHEEFLFKGIVVDEDSWNNLQIKFLTNHTYFTGTNQNLREAKKQEHINAILQKLNK